MNYTLDEVRNFGAPIALRLLIEAVESGAPFVTYNDIREELKVKLNVDIIFPTQIGHAAGALMDWILEIDPKAPLINVLITRANGIPGKGAAGYLATRYKSASLKNWDRVSKKRKLELVERERRKVRGYGGWRKIERKLFGTPVKLKHPGKKGIERDGKSPDGKRGGGPESPQHIKLKEWVAKNPRRIDLGRSFGKGQQEARLSSADVVDVLFYDGSRFVAVEVKSIISDDLDFERGIYQCVKYRAVKEAEEKPIDVPVKAILVTERKLPSNLAARARLLGVTTKVVSVNKAR